MQIEQLIPAEPAAFLVIFASMFVRTLTGFGSAMVSIPFLSLLFGAKYAIPFIMIYECLIDALILLKDKKRTRIELKETGLLILSGLIGIVIGTVVLVHSSEKILELWMGAMLIVFSMIILGGFKLKIQRRKTEFVASGLLGGFLCGSIGMPGPPMALLLSSQGHDKEAFRRIIVIFLTVIDYLTFAFYLAVGLIDQHMIEDAIWLMPALAAGFLAGNFAFGKVEESSFKKLVIGVAALAGFILFFQAY